MIRELVPRRAGDTREPVPDHRAVGGLLADDGRGARAWVAPAPAKPVDPPA